MSTLKSYTCSKCAGILMFDSDQEFFDCPFCGNRYDIVDFHAGEVLDQARACLKEKAFSAAKEKFDQVLDNDPQNFDALLGNILCLLNISSEEGLEYSEKLSGKDLTGAKKELLNAKKISVNERADYFARFLELIESYEKRVKFEKEKETLLSGDTLEDINYKMLSDFQDTREKERNSLPWGLIIPGVILLFLIVFSISMQTGDPIIIGFRVVVFVVVLIALVYAVANKDEQTDAAYKPGNDYEKKLSDKIESAKKTYSWCFSKMKKLHASIANDSKAPENVSESKKLSDNDINAEQSISCDKCGAGLILDKNKRVYQCDHCGVAYGVSLFFGLPMEKALNSINNGQYKDAGQRFSNLLMIDPSDFEALLGKILCSGKWTKVSDINLSEELDDDEMQAVRSGLEEAGKHASDGDRPYFKKMEKLISYFEPYAASKKELESLNNDVSDMETKADVYAIAYEGANYNEDYKESRQKLVNKTFPAQVSMKKLEGEFANVRKELVEERSSCRLVK